jgi:23S rRNA (cytosine1962-C5)-methyltransferase
MRRLRPEGLLVSFSCSNPVDADLFEKIALGAARDMGRPVRLLKQLGPGPDHPTSLAHSEGRYLKGLLLAMMP